MAQDFFDNMTDSLTAPSGNCFPITTSDTLDLPAVTKAVYVGTGGDITLRSVRGNQDVTFRNLSSGAILDVRASHIRATGTTATNLVGMT